MLEQLQLYHYLIKYSYNHFKSLKRVFNCNPYNGINIISFGRVAMLERFKSAINKIIRLKGYKNKIFILNNCKNKIIFKIIIVKIILLIRNNVNDIKYQKPQKLGTSMRFLTLYNPISDWVKFTKV